MSEIRKAKVIDRPEIGLTEYWIVNIPEYCGKILVQKKGTTCPAHRHQKKHETFLVWKGRVNSINSPQSEKMLLSLNSRVSILRMTPISPSRLWLKKRWKKQGRLRNTNGHFPETSLSLAPFLKRKSSDKYYRSN